MKYLLDPKISILFVIYSSYHAYSKNLYLLLFCQVLILISGIIYHNKYHQNIFPNFRYFDMIIVLFGLYHHIDHYNKECFEDYLFIYLYLSGILSYIIGLYLNSNKIHCGIHIFAVLGNIALHNCIEIERQKN